MGIRPKENFQIGPMPPPSLPSVSGHLAPNRQSEGREGQTQEGCNVHQEGERLEDGQLSLKHQHRLVQTVARQRVSPRLSALPPRPPLPCCPSIIRIFSPHLLDTCMNEEIDTVCLQLFIDIIGAAVANK